MAKKSGHEARVERMTWFALVITFLAAYYLNVPGAFTCFAIALILLVSGLYQYHKRWSVGPIMMILVGVSFLLGVYGIGFNPIFDLSLAALAIVVVVITFGVVTKDS
jgi:hypothetical protein